VSDENGVSRLHRQISGGLHYDRLSRDEVNTRACGDCAITTVRWNAQGNAAGRPIPEAARATLVTVKDQTIGDSRASTPASSPDPPQPQVIPVRHDRHPASAKG
jgi:hypothetical protein